MSRSRLNLIGAGKLGRTLAHLWRDQLDVGVVASRQLSTADNAVAFIGAGKADTLDSFNRWPSAEYWLLASPDDVLTELANALVTSGREWSNTTVFHCSGSTSSHMLAPLAAAGALTASAHPIHSFADPQRSLRTFSGSWCLIEGHHEATEQLAELFAAIDAQALIVPRADKALYHAATAMGSNLLVALLHHTATLLGSATELSPQQSRQLLEPLCRQTLDNYFRSDACSALTGPIARGDSNTIERHLQGFADRGADWLTVYHALSQVALDIAAAQGQASSESLHRIRSLLNEQQ